MSIRTLFALGSRFGRVDGSGAAGQCYRTDAYGAAAPASLASGATLMWQALPRHMHWRGRTNFKYEGRDYNTLGLTITFQKTYIYIT